MLFRSDVNQAILEPYYDGGDSYTGHHKHSCILQYQAEGAVVLEQDWDAALITLPAGGSGTFKRCIEPCDISIFDTVTLFSTCPEAIHIQILFDGVLVFDQMGGGKSTVQRSPMHLSSVSEITYQLQNTADRESVMHLHYLGAEMRHIPIIPIYQGNWEGCFAEDPDVSLFNEEFLSEDALADLRQRVKTDPYQKAYERLHNAAERAMTQEPEQWIDQNVSKHYRGGRNFDEIKLLAFVGLIEKNKDMMRMACRYALALSACTYWGCDPMENVPYAVWHHRSFFETAGCASMALVLSFCGNMLTWHGRNILYNAIIIKGLPRVEADFMTMEYIYKMNQGLAFMEGYIPALICLCDRYPRFEMKLDLAEKLLFEMLDKAQNPDGSTDEGAAYWHYTWNSAFYSMIPLARKRGKTLAKYVGRRLSKTAEYGKFLLTEEGKTISVSDCGSSMYSNLCCSGMYQLTGDPVWAHLANETSGSMDLYAMIYSHDIPQGDAFVPAAFADYRDLGLTSVYHNGIQTILISGKSNVTHCHSDKGSFFVYKNGSCILADRGTLSYELANGEYLHKTEAHNAAVPLEADGKPMTQIIADGLYAPYSVTHDNGTFVWESDQTVMWDNPVILKNIRKIISTVPGEYEVMDTFVFTEPHAVSVYYHFPVNADIRTEELSGTAVVSETQDNLIWSHETLTVRTYTTASACEVNIVTKVIL